jgi:hypothetical protein
MGCGTLSGSAATPAHSRTNDAPLGWVTGTPLAGPTHGGMWISQVTGSSVAHVPMSITPPGGDVLALTRATVLPSRPPSRWAPGTTVITELHSNRLTRSLAYASTPSLPSTPQG